MSDAADVIMIARRMIFRHGDRTAELMDARALVNFRAGDFEAGIFWQKVAQAAREMRLRSLVNRSGFLNHLFRAVFEAAPHPYLLLAVDLTIVGANDAFLAATMTQSSGIVGRGVFDVFPDNPATPGSDGVKNAGASFERVLGSGRTDILPLQRYDLRQPDRQFQERWWRVVNVPVFDDDGNVILLMNCATDVTDLVGRDGIYSL